MDPTCNGLTDRSWGHKLGYPATGSDWVPTWTGTLDTGFGFGPAESTAGPRPWRDQGNGPWELRVQIRGNKAFSNASFFHARVGQFLFSGHRKKPAPTSRRWRQGDLSTDDSWSLTLTLYTPFTIPTPVLSLGLAFG